MLQQGKDKNLVWLKKKKDLSSARIEQATFRV